MGMGYCLAPALMAPHQRRVAAHHAPTVRLGEELIPSLVPCYLFAQVVRVVHEIPTAATPDRDLPLHDGPSRATEAAKAPVDFSSCSTQLLSKAPASRYTQQRVF